MSTKRKGIQTTLLALAIGVLLLWLVVLPLGLMFFGSFTSSHSPLEAGGVLTLEKYRLAYSDPELRRAWWNTILFSTGTVAFATMFGLLIAVFLSRTDVPFRGTIETLTLLPLAIPPYLLAIGWIMLLNPTIGIMNRALMEWLGLRSAPISIYGMAGMIFVEGLYHLPVVYLIVKGSLRSVDPAMEEVASLSGAGPLYIFRRITLPLARPVILAAMVLVFVRSVGSFAIPIYIGSRKGINVISTKIYDVISETFPTNYTLAAALSASLLVLTALLLFAQRVFTGRAERYQIVGGRGYSSGQFMKGAAGLGNLRFLISGGILTFLFVTLVLPVGMIVITSFQSPLIDLFDFSSLSLKNYVSLFNSPLNGRAIRNSLLLSFVGAGLGVTVSALTSYLIHRTRIRFRAGLHFLSILPGVVPGVTLAVAFLWTYLTMKWLGIYGTLWILLIAYVTRFLPEATRATQGGIQAIHSQLEEAARITGASLFRILRRIIFPLARENLFSAFLLLFMIYLREFAMSIFLTAHGNEVISMAIFDAWRNANLEGAMAVSTVLVGILMITLAVSRWVFRIRVTGL
ncbi:MAG TPA: iron ABC transporter permease [bacterium]|nr:iron ABC transporter permease [bacterium]